MEMIGDGERLLVVVAKIGEARELVCDRVREGERALRRRRADEAVSSCIDVIERAMRITPKRSLSLSYNHHWYLHRAWFHISSYPQALTWLSISACHF
jgi:hypothetical protein